ncbi:MAG: HAD family hydrolase [Lachnospiraceae bacterium]|nr:HAD family hydrolase [Lachnospiraceae bacterium]MDE7205320.1 HAD family hydrolase [Lachnospiraceae bacterium]
MSRKIAFFDVDGTLTSEVDGRVPEDTAAAIAEARANGNLMFINTGRCFQNVEPRFREIGWDGYVCGCGTNIYCGGQDVLHVCQTHSTTMQILNAARRTNVDILFESRNQMAFDLSRQLHHPGAIRLYQSFVRHGYEMPEDLENPDFLTDKFVIWHQDEAQLTAFRQVSDKWFECIDREGTFREFVPYSYSKASGIQYVLNHYNLKLTDAYAFGDSNNDLSMLTYVPHSVAMGNASPESLFNQVEYVTAKSSCGGIRQALKHYCFL